MLYNTGRRSIPRFWLPRLAAGYALSSCCKSTTEFTTTIANNRSIQVTENAGIF